MTIRNIAQSDAETAVIKKLLFTDQVLNLMGSEEWDLTEEEEMLLWDILKRENGGVFP